MDEIRYLSLDIDGQVNEREPKQDTAKIKELNRRILVDRVQANYFVDFNWDREKVVHSKNHFNSRQEKSNYNGTKSRMDISFMYMVHNKVANRTQLRVVNGRIRKEDCLLNSVEIMYTCRQEEG